MAYWKDLPGTGPRAKVVRGPMCQSLYLKWQHFLLEGQSDDYKKYKITITDQNEMLNIHKETQNEQKETKTSRKKDKQK